MSKIFQVTTSKYGDAVYNTTPGEFLDDIRQIGYDGSINLHWDDNGDYYTDDDGDCILIEYNRKNIDANVVVDLD